MFFRRRLASRISRLKEFTGAELPIVSEVPLPAEVMSVESFNPKTLAEGLPTFLRDRFKQAPGMCWGKAYGREAGRWYSVSFPITLTSPSVVCVGEGRLGSITTKSVERVSTPRPKEILRVDRPPLKDIARAHLYWWHCNTCLYSWLALERQAWSTCPECGSRNIYNEPVTREGSEWMLRNLYWWAARKGLGDWGAFNWARDLVIAAFEWLGAAMGRIIYVMIDALTPQIDYVRDRVNEVVRDTYNNLMDQIDYVRDRANEVLSENFDKLMDQIDAVEDRINKRLVDLYEMWGIPKNIALTPLHVRNVTSHGFEFLSLGNTTAYWFAVGK